MLVNSRHSLQARAAPAAFAVGIEACTVAGVAAEADTAAVGTVLRSALSMAARRDGHFNLVYGEVSWVRENYDK